MKGNTDRKQDIRNEKRTDSERDATRSTPGTDANDLFTKDPQDRGPQGGMSAQGMGTPLKSDLENAQSVNTKTPKHLTDEGSMNGRESQRGMNQLGIDQRGRQGTANQHNG